MRWLNDSAWVALAARLTLFVDATSAKDAVVMDESNDLWCWTAGASARSDDTPFELLDRALATAKKPLRRGGHVDVVRWVGEPYYVARSFAGIYVVLAWFGAPFDARAVREEIDAALPEIEALTLALPPPEGPDAGVGARRVRGR